LGLRGDPSVPPKFEEEENRLETKRKTELPKLGGGGVGDQKKGKKVKIE